MKKAISLLLVSAMVLLLVACGSTNTSSNSASSSGQSSNDGTTYTLRIGHTCSNSHPYQAGALKFKELVEAASDGRIQVEVYPSAQLGNERDMVEGLQAGTLEMTVVSIGTAASFLEGADLFNLPFVFNSTEHFQDVIYGEIGQEYISHVDGTNGLKVMSLGYPVFRIPFSNSGPWTKLEDFKGMKIRTQEVNAHMDAYEALGAAPTPMASSEQHVAYQTGALNGGENSITTIYSEKYYESCPDITLLPVICGGAFWLMSQSFYDSLPADLQQVIDDNTEEFSKYCDDLTIEGENTLRAEIEAEGGVFHEVAPEELARIQEAAAPVISKYQKELPDWAADLLTQIMAMS